MQNRVIVSKKNEDGSYDTGDYLFDGIDLYHGDRVNKKLEISPIGSPVKNVNIQLVCTRDNIEYEFKPEFEEGEYYLKTDKYPGLTIHFEDINGVKYKADKNGVIRIINVLSSPLDFYIFIEAEPFTVKQISKTTVLDDVSLIVWSN